MAAVSWKSHTRVTRGGREGTAGDVQVTEAWRLGHSSTHGLCDWALHRRIANTTASPGAPWFVQPSPSVYSKAEEFHRGKLLQAGKHRSCRDRCGVWLDKERRSGVCLEVHLSCLLAKVNWRRAKDIAQERRETVFFPSVFVFSRKTQKLFVSNLNTCLCRGWC